MFTEVGSIVLLQENAEKMIYEKYRELYLEEKACHFLLYEDDTMLETNPSRIDYYKRYMDIIEAYNAEQDRTTIEKTFMELMNLVKDMSTEEQRYIREGFSSDEELSIYDLLFSDSLTKKDIEKIKALSVELLKKTKDRIAQMDHWTDKDETRATVQNLIRDELYMNIPDSMFGQLDHYREVIYEHVYTHYKEVA